MDNPIINNTNRRTFIKNTTALAGAAVMAGPLWSFAGAQKQTDAKTVGIQIGPESFVDEGIEEVLDKLQNLGAVNTLFLTAFTYGRGFAGRTNGGRQFPDHGKPLSKELFFHGGYYGIPHPEFYKDTVLKDTRAPDHGNRDMIAEVLAAAKKRGMKVFCGVEDRWDSAFDVPGLEQCTEIDLAGNRLFTKGKRITQCIFNPNVKAFWKSLVADLCSSYEIDGLLFLNERTGPLMSTLGASPFSARIGNPMGVACFCKYHEQAAKDYGLDFNRVKQGYTKLAQYVQQAKDNQRPTDGYYVQYQRILLEYPEIIAYDRLFDYGKHQTVREVRAVAKEIRKELKLVFHIEHTISFNPFIRASLDYERLAENADFLKPVAYNNCGGERYANFIRNLGSTIYKDLPVEEIFQMNNHLISFEKEAGLTQLATAGLSPDYVSRETKRALDGVKGKCGILTGIDIDVPVEEGSRRASPEDTYAATMAALKAGAQGVILSRKFSEMRLTNLAGAGKAIREFTS